MNQEHPILFKAPLVRAILAGKKTQTRRLIKPQPPKSATVWNMADGIARLGALGSSGYGDDYRSRWKDGDRLWVREAVKAEEMEDGLGGVRYLADDHFEPIENTDKGCEQFMTLYDYRGGGGFVVPPIHAPRWTSRIELLVTGVRAERLQDISESDAKAEGVECPSTTILHGSHRYAFMGLWDEINSAPYAWADNPFAWVIEFERIK